MYMKVRIAQFLLCIPAIIVDFVSLPVAVINWVLTGNILESMSEKLWAQK
jgi:hypothetical protein